MEERLKINIPIEAVYTLDISLNELYDWLYQYSRFDIKYTERVVERIRDSLTRMTDGKFDNQQDEEYLGSYLCRYFDDDEFTKINKEFIKQIGLGEKSKYTTYDIEYYKS